MAFQSILSSSLVPVKISNFTALIWVQLNFAFSSLRSRHVCIGRKKSADTRIQGRKIGPDDIYVTFPTWILDQLLQAAESSGILTSYDLIRLLNTFQPPEGLPLSRLLTQMDHWSFLGYFHFWFAVPALAIMVNYLHCWILLLCWYCTKSTPKEDLKPNRKVPKALDPSHPPSQERSDSPSHALTPASHTYILSIWETWFPSDHCWANEKKDTHIYITQGRNGRDCFSLPLSSRH